MIDVHLPASLFFPELPGGSNQYFRYGPFLLDRGVRLNIHTIRRPHHEESDLTLQGIEIHRYEAPQDLSFLEEFKLLTSIAVRGIKEGPNPAVLHPLGISATNYRSALWLSRFRFSGIPCCFHFTEVPVPSHKRFPSSVKERMYRKMMVFPYTKLLMCSRVMGRAFQEVAGISAKRIEPIPNGIDLSVFSPVSAERKRELRGALGLPPDAPVVLFVGSVIERKGVDLLVEAWEAVHRKQPQARLVIAGSTGPRLTIRDTRNLSENERYVEKVFQQVDGLSDPESVVFAGETDQIRDYYRAADLFAFASHWEGLPSVVLESMACGVPCVVAPFIGLPADGEEYGISGEHYVRSSHDPRQMAGDIVRMIEDEESRNAMGGKACQWIRDTQEMSMAAGRLAEVYHDMVA